MTLYVIDNGESYEDHSLYLVETSLPLEAVQAAISANASYEVLVHAETPTWLSAMSHGLFINWDNDATKTLRRLRPWFDHPDIVEPVTRYAEQARRNLARFVQTSARRTVPAAKMEASQIITRDSQLIDALDSFLAGRS